MRNGKNDERFARLFKLQATVGKLVLDGKRSPEEVCDALQALVEKGAMQPATLLGVIAALKFDYVNPNITKHFTLEPVRRERKMFHFDRPISSKGAVKQMEKEGWSPANLAELLEYAKGEWNGKDCVVALGSIVPIDCHHCVPCLFRCGAGRGLGLGWWSGDWVATIGSLPLATEYLGH